MIDQVGPRSSCRYQVILPVACTAPLQRGRPPQVVFGWTFNLSESGACVELPKPFPRGMRLRLVFPSAGESLPLSAQVEWVAASRPPDARSVHGLSFPRLTQKEQQGLQTLLGHLGEQRLRVSRLPARLPVDCRLLAVPAPALRGWTGDLSPEGGSLLLPAPLPAGTRLLVTLPGPRGPQSVAATVAWGTPAEPGLHRHGVQFVGLNPAWRQLIEGLAVPSSASQAAALC